MPKPLVIHVLQGVSIIVLLCLMSSTSPARELTRGIIVKAQTPTGQSKEIELYSGYHALIIGAGAYTKGWPRLPNPAKDAREVGETLRTMGWEVEVVTEPDSAILRRELNKLVVGPGRDPSKAVLVWFSGHGHTLEEADGTKLGYIVPVDAPNPDQDLLGFMDKAMSMRNLQTISKQIRSKHVLMAFDSCFSGVIFRLVRAKPSPYIQEKVAYPVREFITAGGEDEQVPDRSIFKTVFLQAVEEGFGDSNQDGYVTGEELGAYVQEQVINYSRQAQHPQFGKINNPKLDKGDFVFVKREVSEKEKLRLELARLRRQNQAIQQENEQLNSLLARMDRLEDKVQSSQVHTSIDPEQPSGDTLGTEPFAHEEDTGAGQKDPRPRLAILPFRIKGHGHGESFFVKPFKEVLAKNLHCFTPSISHYNIGNGFENKDMNTLLSGTVAIWFRENSFSAFQPNMSFLVKMGQQFQIDCFCLVKVRQVDRVHNSIYEIFLVDISIKKIFSSKQTGIKHQEERDSFRSLINNVFIEYNDFIVNN